MREHTGAPAVEKLDQELADVEVWLHRGPDAMLAAATDGR
jgi:hypothetical protein